MVHEQQCGGQRGIFTSYANAELNFQEVPASNANHFPFIGMNNDASHRVYKYICSEMEELCKSHDDADISDRLIKIHHEVV